MGERIMRVTQGKAEQCHKRWAERDGGFGRQVHTDIAMCLVMSTQGTTSINVVGEE